LRDDLDDKDEETPDVKDDDEEGTVETPNKTEEAKMPGL